MHVIMSSILHNFSHNYMHVHKDKLTNLHVPTLAQYYYHYYYHYSINLLYRNCVYNTSLQ